MHHVAKTALLQRAGCGEPKRAFETRSAQQWCPGFLSPEPFTAETRAALAERVSGVKALTGGGNIAGEYLTNRGSVWTGGDTRARRGD
jgi:hypothetical protein